MAKAKFADTNTAASEKKTSSIKKTFEQVIRILFGFRKIVMALPVVYYAFKLAAYNETHLPVEVGLFLQNNGYFLRMIDRNTAVLAPLFVTFACLFLMMFSKKAMYAWAISIFTLALPVLILVSNIYPA